MRAGEGKPPTAAEVAMYGHVAATLRKALAERGWTIADLNQALGRDRGNAAAYLWLGAHGAPGGDARVALVKLLGVRDGDLRRRTGDEVPAVIEAPGAPAAVASQRRVVEVLAFTANNAGEARIRLDVTLPMAAATPLLRMLLDAGLVFSPGEA